MKLLMGGEEKEGAEKSSGQKDGGRERAGRKCVEDLEAGASKA